MNCCIISIQLNENLSKTLSTLKFNEIIDLPSVTVVILTHKLCIGCVIFNKFGGGFLNEQKC